MHKAWRFRAAALVTLAVGAAAVGFSLEVRAVDADLRQPLTLAGAGYAGSRACQHCHPSHYASWHRSFHRSMTQEASAANVLGDFARASFEYRGVQARMQRDNQGRFVMDFAGRSGETWKAVVTRTVGSRRYQQYLAREGDVYFRLPLGWNIEEKRWIHLNGAFLTPDPSSTRPDASIERVDYDRHVTRWNDNCIYCHNVAPNPGLDLATLRFDTRVAELGIACEACHGPGARHVARNHDPLRRFALHLSGRADPTIADPARLSPARSAQICGHCHGQRLAPNIERVHAHGDRFLPGEDLASYSRPLARDTILNGQREVFAARFWPDGTARLTAYEYQGLLQSACARRGGLTCTSCHGMHEGDPRGQMRPSRTDDAACTGCHMRFAGERAKAEHSHHPANSAGARCLDCHMPRVVYGLVGAHRSHRIDSPRPGLKPEQSRPDACTLCHIDKSRAWATASIRRWTNQQPEPEDSALPETTRLLFAGDPIERAIAVAAVGRGEPRFSAPTLPARLGLLLEALENDGYPAVRAIAWRSLRSLLAAHYPRQLPDVAAFTATDTQEVRRRVLSAIAGRLPGDAVTRPGMQLVSLRSQANDAQIFIGE